MRRTHWLFVLAAASTLPTGVALADTIHVPADLPTIQAAVDFAQSGDTVLVADGVWTGVGNRDIALHGVDIVVRSANGAANCIIDCQGTVANPHRAFLIESGETRATVIQGFTIRRGATTAGAIADEFNGGAIRIISSSPTIRGCVFEDNACGCWGGAVYAGHGGSPLVTECVFSDNFSNDDGGGAFSWNGAHLEITSSLFVNNLAQVTGGAITAFDTITLRNVTIIGSYAAYGPAVYAFQGEITNSIVWGNGPVPVDGSVAVRYSIVQGGYPGVGNLDQPPRFMPDGYHLRLDSPAINAGDPAFVPPSEQRDIDGQTRRFMGRVDMGADEFYREAHRAR